MSLQQIQSQPHELKQRLKQTEFRQAEFDQLKSRLDTAQLERTVAALHETLPEAKAAEAEATLRRMFARAKRWEALAPPRQARAD